MVTVCFITNNVNQYGGIDRVLAELVNHFSTRLGYRVFIYSLFSKESHLFFNIDDSVTVLHAGLSLDSDIKENIKKLLNDMSFSHIITLHADIAFEFTKVIGSFKDLYWIATEHSAPFDYTFKRRLANLYTYKCADKFVLLTDAAARYYRRRGLRNTRVIPNPISFTCEQPSALTSKTIVAIGRLEKVKRFDLLLQAFSKTAVLHPDWKLNLVGGGSLEGNLKRLAESLGIQHQVEFFGVQKDIKRILLDSSIMAITSEYEGFSLVALEAMECGLPVVSFELPSLREINANADAMRFAPNRDVETLSIEMNRLIEDEELRRTMGTAAKERAQGYSIKSIGEMWRRVIEHEGKRC